MSNRIGFDANRPLHEYCRNVTNRDGDTFVGIKSEIIEGEHHFVIHFPLGHRLSKDDEHVRQEILRLFMILQEYNDEKSIFSSVSREQSYEVVKFPIQAYITVLFYYLNYNYYEIRDSNYCTGTSGKISMSRTLKKERPIATQKGLIYPKFQVKQYSDTDKELITEINKYCVYESNLKIGWLYKLPQISKPLKTRELSFYKQYLNDVWLTETKDSEKRLFKAMLDIIDFTSRFDESEEFYFGTNRFEYIWEELIQSTFGNAEKEYYFPKTKWILRAGENRENKAIEPDTVMKYGDDIFVLDAKYYKFGLTQQAKDLPSSSSINKQISYGEYIATNHKFEEERRQGMRVFNAFLLPYDCQMTPYNQLENHYYFLGEAISDWKSNTQSYERVQGILIDVKFLIENVVTPNQKEIMELSKKILENF